MKLRNAGFVLSFFMTTAILAEPATVVSHELTERARQFLAAELPPATAGSEREINIAAPDPRLQLVPCPEAPVGFWPNNARQTGTTVVGVRCPVEGGWQLFLPVQIQEWASVLVASRPLRPGERLQPNDFKPAKVSRNQLRGEPYTDPSRLLGAATRQAIASGQPLTDNLVCQVCRGDSVDIAAGDDGFQVRMKGVAEGAGNVGDQIRVRSLSSRRTIQAVVSRGGEVQVRL